MLRTHLSPFPKHPRSSKENAGPKRARPEKDDRGAPVCVGMAGDLVATEIRAIVGVVRIRKRLVDGVVLGHEERVG